ncbi:hypothetical protein SDC9_64382 [bioreactor metagenome]|uniref:Uncharacterized protein n=1 Tax=bioreactor metagenome TaxID=1076179 RepID=A0A644XQD4_9ZZZZ
MGAHPGEGFPPVGEFLQLGPDLEVGGEPSLEEDNGQEEQEDNREKAAEGNNPPLHGAASSGAPEAGREADGRVMGIQPSFVRE